jgi:hypothetical protein
MIRRRAQIAVLPLLLLLFVPWPLAAQDADFHQIDRIVESAIATTVTSSFIVRTATGRSRPSPSS